MIIKVCQFKARKEQGERLVQIFQPGEMEKAAEFFSMGGTRAPMLPEVQKYLDRLRPDPTKIYVLVNALGAGEYWSSNINGDYFPEASLIHQGPVYGYETFYGAFPYKHHCFPAGTPVRMADGLRKPIDELVVGDVVTTLEGPRRVTEIMQRPYEGPGTSLTLRGESDPLVGTDDHPVQVFRREQVHCRCRYNKLTPTGHEKDCVEYRQPIGDPEWAPMSSVLAGDYLVFPQPKHGDVVIPCEFARLVGWVAAEGHLGARGIIQFSFSENNQVDINAVTTCLEANGLHVTTTPRPQYGTVIISACSAEVHARLGEYVTGVLSEKTLTSKILEWDQVSLQQMLGVYIDGDGHVSQRGKNEGQLRIRSSSRQMLRMLSDVIRALSIPTTIQWDAQPGEMISPTNGKVYHTTGSGTVTVEASFSPDVAQYSRKLHRREMKKQASRKMLGNVFLVQVMSSDEVWLNENVYNLSVDCAQHYVAGEVVVHNCNKDPSKSFGRVELSCWHDGMKRVELVVVIDRDRARQFAAEDVCDKLDRGLFPDVSMGCLPKGSPVFCADGRRVPIEMIKEGDTVLTHKGRDRRVTSVMVRPHKGVIYHVKAYGHRNALVLTGEHPLWVIRQDETKCRPSSKDVNRGRKQCVCIPEAASVKVGCIGCTTEPRYQFDWVRTDEVQEGDYLAIPVPNYETSVRFTADQARLLGYYLAEGFVLRTKAGSPMGVQFCTNLWETGTHEELYQLGDRLGLNVTEYNAEDRSGKYISIWDRSLAELCTAHCGEGALTKRLSRDLLGADSETLLLLLGAYANGDGGCYKGSLYFSTASEELSEQLRLATARCGMIASVSEIVHKPSKLVPKETIEFQVWVGTDTAWKLTTSRYVFGESARLCSKRFFYTYEGVTYLVTPIESVEEVLYDDDVYNFGVEEDESYLVEGLAVHNCKVPYDLCSICTDWKKYRHAQTTFNPNIHESVGKAVLMFHQRDPIRGISVTRNDYCEHLKTMLNKILSDGRKVYAINDYPRFFDISFVFIGADKTAKVMAKLAMAHPEFNGIAVPSWYVAEQLGHQPASHKEMEKAASIFILPPRPPKEKVASVSAVRAMMREKKASQRKRAEIIKDVVPSQFGGKAVPTEVNTPNLPSSILNRLGCEDLSSALSTPTSMGILLKPREFQRITIIRLGKPELADELDQKGLVFPPCGESDTSIPMGSGHFSSVLKKVLLPFLEDRSYLEPVAKRRVIRITLGPQGDEEDEPEEVMHGDPLLTKISAAYNGYLDRVGSCLDGSQQIVEENPDLWAATFGVGLSDGFTKEGAGVNPAVVLGAVGGAALLSQLARHQKERAMMGARGPTGLLTNLAADHPRALMALAGLGALKAQGSNIPNRLFDKAKTVVNNVASAALR